MDVAVLLIFDWRDGPLGGVLRGKHQAVCWYFKMIAERLESEALDDRLFGLWEISDADCAVLLDQFADASPGAHVWPERGGIGSPAARKIVDSLLSVERFDPNLIVRTPDFVDIQGVWKAVGR